MTVRHTVCMVGASLLLTVSQSLSQTITPNLPGPVPDPCGPHGCPPTRSKIARCYTMMNQWNRQRHAYNTGQCSYRVPGTAIDNQCRQLKARLTSWRANIAAQCAGIFQITPGD